MGLAQSCLGAPKATKFEAPVRSALETGSATRNEAKSHVKPSSLVAAHDKQDGFNIPDSSCTIKHVCKPAACIAPGAGARGGGDCQAGVLDTAQLSDALTATATTASLQSTFLSTDGYPHSAWDFGPPTTDDEQSRVQSLRALDILESVSQGRRCKLDEEADMVLGAVMQMFNAMVSMLVLFDDTRIIIRNALGVLKPREFPYRWSFCAYTLTKHRPQTLVVPDATKDVRFVDNPFVRGAPHVRFYCGAPLVSASGHILGTLCFADSKPRPDFDVSKCYLINNMAEIMVRQLERYTANAGPAGPIDAETTALARVARTIECYESVTGLVDISLPDGWMLMYVNEAWDALYAPWSRKQMVGRPLQRLLVLEEDPDKVPKQPQRQMQQQPDAAGSITKHVSTPNACFAAPDPVGTAPAPKCGSGATAAGVEGGDRKRPASAAGIPEATKLLGLIRGFQGGEAPATPAAEAPAVESMAAQKASSATTSDACCVSRFESGTSSSGEGPGIVVAGDSAGDAKLMAMSPTERRQWRQQQEKLPVAWRDAWARFAEPLRAGEEVQLGRARLMLEDGRPSNTVVLVTVRSANCHVLDAAVRMPVGVPHQLVLPTSILAAGGGGASAASPTGPESGADAGATQQVTDLSSATSAVTTADADAESRWAAANADNKSEPCYCTITLTRVDQGEGVNGDVGGAMDQPQQLPPGTSPVTSGACNAVFGTPSGLGVPTPSPSTCLHAPASSTSNVVPAAAADVPSPGRGPSSSRMNPTAYCGGRPSIDASRPSRFTASACTRGSMRSTASQSVSSWAYGMEPFPGLKLGHLLGKGGYGRVFSAMYKGQRVAAKVVSNAMLKTATCVNGVTLEALLAQEIEHPYIVRTYKCLVRSYESGEQQFAGSMSARNSTYCSSACRTPSDRPPHRGVVVPMTPSALSNLPGGQSDGVDSPRMSRLVRASDAGRCSVAVAGGGSMAEASQDPIGCGGGDDGTVGARELPRAPAAAAAQPLAAAVSVAESSAARGPTATSTAAPGLIAPVVPVPPAAAAPAPAPPVGDYDSFDAGTEEAVGGMIDQLNSAGPVSYMGPAAASHAPAEVPMPISQLPHHMQQAIAAPDRLSAIASGAAAQSAAIATQGSASVEHAMAALAAQQGRAAPRVGPGINVPADPFSPGPDPGTIRSVFSTAAASAGASAAAGGADASPQNSVRPQTDTLAEGETWILQEFCRGGTLQDAIDSGRMRTEPSRIKGQPHMPRILLTAQEVASGMACVHSRGYMHGDLSAVNVLLADAPGSEEGGNSGRGWVAKVTDFGLAKHLPDPTKPYVSSAYGVITHCAPEVLKSHTQTPKADVYSFGVLLWQMYTGSRPWANMNRFQIFGAVTCATSPGLRFLPTQQPPSRYSDLTMRCLSYDPAARPTFAEVCEELRLMTYEAAAAGQLPI